MREKGRGREYSSERWGDGEMERWRENERERERESESERERAATVHCTVLARADFIM